MRTCAEQGGEAGAAGDTNIIIKQSRGGRDCEVVTYYMSVRDICLYSYIFQRDAPEQTWGAEVREIGYANLRGASGTSRHRHYDRGGCGC